MVFFFSSQKHYSESKDLDRLSKVHGELDELKDIMVKNIDNIAMRGERLELLINKTENLSANVSESVFMIDICLLLTVITRK